MDRPAISQPLKRQVLVEAGHRCAIPTCRQTPVELAHIVPYAQVREHTFENLIALCPTCHSRYDNGDIDRQAMLQYKANLSVLNGRYGDLEQRVLRVFSQHPTMNAIQIPGGFDILMMNLLEDGLVIKSDMVAMGGGAVARMTILGAPAQTQYVLTDKGRDFIRRWLTAHALD